MEHIDQVLEKVRQCQDEETLFDYCRANRPGVVLEVAKSTHATPRVLEMLSRHYSITVRHEVAKNCNAALETLTRLSSDKDMLVRDYARRTILQKGSHQIA